MFVLKRTMIVVTLLGLGGIAAAQNSRFTVFAGYAYGNTNYASSQRTSLHGWEASLEGIRLRPWLTFVVDGSAQYGWNQFPISCVTVPVCTPAIPDVRAKQYTLLGGPQISRFHGNFRTFAHALAGATRVNVATTGFFDSDTKWAAGAGGGVDYKWRGPFSWRVQADYLRLNVFQTHQNMIRASTGLVVRF
jgi:hypothetical protein